MRSLAPFALGLALVGVWAPGWAASPPFPSAPYLETLTSTRLLRFANGSWSLNGQLLYDSEPIIVASNDQSYVTIELYGQQLPGSVTIEFIDAETNTVQDTVTLAKGTSAEMVRTIPLSGRVIRAHVIAGTGLGAGFVAIARGMVPILPPDESKALAPGLTRLSLFKTGSPADRMLANAAQGVALIQIADGNDTVACTGFLVAVGMIATAAHCIRNAVANKQQDQETSVCQRVGIVFDYWSTIRGNEMARAIHCRKLAYLSSTENSVQAPKGPKGTLVDRGDIALLELDSSLVALPDGSPRPHFELRTDPTATGEIVSVIEHPQGFDLRASSGCTAQSISPSPLIYHTCGTAPGSSGAPIVASDGTAWRVIGMHTCCADQQAIKGDTPKELIKALEIANYGIAASAIAQSLQAAKP